MTTDELVEEILEGSFDKGFDEIYEALKQRLSLLRGITTAKTMATTKIGDIGKLHGLSPKALNGRSVEIVEKKKTTLRVKFIDQPRRGYKFPQGSVIRVPAVSFEKAA